MDPDVALARIRNLTVTIFDTDLGALAESIEALDGWLSKGGFPPAAWGAAHEPGWARAERLAEALCVESLTRADDLDELKARAVWHACAADADHPLVAHFTHLADRVLATLQGEDETAVELHREAMRDEARS